MSNPMRFFSLIIIATILTACGGGSSDSSGSSSSTPSGSSNPSTNSNIITTQCATTDSTITVTTAGCVTPSTTNPQTAICISSASQQSLKLLSGNNKTAAEVTQNGSTFNNSLTINGIKYVCG